MILCSEMASENIAVDQDEVQLLKVSVNGDVHVNVNDDEQEHQTDVDNVYTVDDAIEKLGFGPFQIFMSIFAGLIWVADAMEFMLLSVLSPALKCQWDLTSSEEALITSFVFIGTLVGNLVWGPVSDVFGRKKALFLTGSLILLFGVLSALPMSPDDGKIPGYPWLVLCRLGLGFSAAGASQVVTFYAEFMPKKVRGSCITMLEIWWGIGSIFGAALALGVMRPGGLGWHWFLGLAAIPLALALPMFLLVPESPRFYSVKGKLKKAEKVIKQIAWLNCKPLPKGRIITLREKHKLNATGMSEVVVYRNDSVSLLDVHGADSGSQMDEEVCDENPLLHQSSHLDKQEEDRDKTLRVAQCSCSIGYLIVNQMKKYADLFKNGAWKQTILLICIWFSVAWLYYGVVLLTTTLLQYDPHCGIVTTLDENTTNLTCSVLDENDYLKILWTATAELPGILLTLVLVEVIGRKLTMGSELLATMVVFLLLLVCTTQVVLTLFLFLIRAFTTGAFQVAYVYTPEVYPTEIRASAVDFFSATARIGAIITPYVAQVLLHRSDYATLALYAGTALLSAIATLFLSVETKGKPLKEVT